MLTLGINGNFSSEYSDIVPNLAENFFHDSSAALIRDGELIAAVEEERLNRIKKTTKFPSSAIKWCLAQSNVSLQDIDAIGYYLREDFIDKALNYLYIAHSDRELKSSRQLIKERLRDTFDCDISDDKIVYVPHHIAHATSTYFHSGFRDALVVVIDGAGEEQSTTVYAGRDGELSELVSHPVKESLGGLYESGTRLLGYGFGDEYKVMGLAPYGDSSRYREVFQQLYSLDRNGQYNLDISDPRFMAPNRLEMLFVDGLGFSPRRTGERFQKEHMDLAAGLQAALEDISLHVLKYWQSVTGLSKLCFSGGVAHNSSLNGKILQSGLFEEVFIHPASHDAGAGEGAGLAVQKKLVGSAMIRNRLGTSSTGPEIGDSQRIGQTLDQWSSLVQYEQNDDIVERTAQLLSEGAVVGWAHGRSEYGPRALGNRSILADARPKENKDRINAMVKKRESYRPFAPVVTREAAEKYFDLPNVKANYEFMSFVVPVREKYRDELGAVTHVDGTARIQIIDPESNQRFYRLVRRFGELTGTPVLLNTSFNNNAEPIVQSVEEALTCFLTTELDYLVIEDFLVSRNTSSTTPIAHYVIKLRPMARIAKKMHTTQGAPDNAVTHEIYFDYAGGYQQTVSADVFDILQNVDGTSTVAELSSNNPGDIEKVTKELHDLWQLRFFTLTPHKAYGHSE